MPRWLQVVLDFFLPQYCYVCRRPSGARVLCDRCVGGLPVPASPLCSICGLPFGGAGEDHLCWRCLARRPYFEQARACTLYRAGSEEVTPITQLIHRFKYGRDVTLAATLGHILASSVLAPGPHDLVVPVPLHKTRLRQRGFNQAAVLGKWLAGRRGVPLDPFVLLRTRATPTQVGLSEKERSANVAGAFAVRNRDAVRNRSILLVDDVYTTGATVAECAKVLRRAGARRVDVLVLARAVLR